MWACFKVFVISGFICSLKWCSPTALSLLCSHPSSVLAQLLSALSKACVDTLFELDQVKWSWICFFARNSEGCQARILVLGLPKQSSLMLSTGREHHLGLIFISRKTFELFQTEHFPSLLHHYKNCELPYGAEPGCISGLQSQQEEQPAFWLPWKLCSPRKSDETFECTQACSSTVWFLRDPILCRGPPTLHRQQHFWVLCGILLQQSCCQVLQKFPGWRAGCEEHPLQGSCELMKHLSSLGKGQKEGRTFIMLTAIQ